MANGYGHWHLKGTMDDPKPKPTVNKERQRQTQREKYVGSRYVIMNGFNSQYATNRMRAWIEGFMRDDWGKNK